MIVRLRESLCPTRLVTLTHQFGTSHDRFLLIQEECESSTPGERDLMVCCVLRVIVRLRESP